MRGTRFFASRRRSSTQVITGGMLSPHSSEIFAHAKAKRSGLPDKPISLDRIFLQTRLRQPQLAPESEDWKVTRLALIPQACARCQRAQVARSRLSSLL